MALLPIGLSFVAFAPSSAAQEPDSARVLLVVGWAEQEGAEAEAARIASEAEQLLRANGERLVDTSHVASSATPEPMPDGFDEEIRVCINDAIRAFAARDIQAGNQKTLTSSFSGDSDDPRQRNGNRDSLLLSGCLLTERPVGECRPIRNIGMDAGADAPWMTPALMPKPTPPRREGVVLDSGSGMANFRGP